MINRCEALMETRDKLSSHLAEMEFHINNESDALEKMNEEKMVKTLNYNVKLGCLQTIFEKVVLYKVAF